MIESETRNLNRLRSRRAFVATSASAAVGLLSACNPKADEPKQAGFRHENTQVDTQAGFAWFHSGGS